MVKKARVLEMMLAAAAREAGARGIPEDDWRAEALAHESKRIVEDLFFSIQFDCSDENESVNYESIDRWAHRKHAEIENDRLMMRFDRSIFRKAAENYLERPWMRNDQLDWFIVDALTYAELIATLDFVRANTSSLIGYMGRDKPPTTLKLLLAFYSAFGWLIFLLALCAVYIVNWILFVTLLSTAVGFRVIHYLKKRKLKKLLECMERSYCALTDDKPSWRLVWAEFARSRVVGAVWDTVAYRLVESRFR